MEPQTKKIGILVAGLLTIIVGAVLASWPFWKQVSILPETTSLESPIEETADHSLDGAIDRVIDGDTVDVWQGGETVRVRLLGVDTPESVDPRKGVECFGIEAGEHLRTLLDNHIVTLEYDQSQGQIDKYGRTLAYLLLPDGTNVNKKMISDGYAYEYTYGEPYRYQSDFKLAEAEARETQIGLWSSDTCGGNR
jgi:micrococcal nuclease